MENAKQQANELAQAAGVTLGAVQSINYYNNYPSPVLADAKGGGSASTYQAASVPVTPGQLTFTVDVNIVYAIQQGK